MSRRHDLLIKLTDIIKDLLNGVDYDSDAHNNVHPLIKFWDEIEEYPYVGITFGNEAREYQPGGVKWAYVQCTIRVYVQEEESNDSLNKLLEDIEDILDRNNNIVYQENMETTYIEVQTITTDEGILAPLGVGEITALIRYDLPIFCS